MSTTRLRALAVIAFGLAAIALPGAANAAPPANDAFVDASSAPLPFSDSVDVGEATLEGGEPSAWCWSLGGSVWYRLQPSTDSVVRITTTTSPFYFDHVVNVYRQTGTGLAGLSPIACGYPWSGTTAQLTGGDTYYLQAGRASWSSGATLHLNVEVVLPPANDDFGDAMPVGALPFSHSVDTTAAGVEASEPTPTCGYGQSAGTVWYAFTPSQTGSYSASVPYSGFSSQVAAYAGDGLGSLDPIGCRAFGDRLTFRAEAGRTYYLQVGGLFGSRGNLTFHLDVAPAPVAQFWYWPPDPSTFDAVSFSSNSFDPGGNPIVEYLYEFGDGSSETGCCPQHRYLTDGDYTARLTITTSDGRVASTEQPIRVRTHDVAITRFSAPQTASAGQTRDLTIGVRNARYAENVTVQLYRSRVGGGFDLVGSLTQAVPVRAGNRTTSFSILYTFTADDAAVGKVTFKAVAVINGARDALPADNEAIAAPTRIMG